MAEPILDFHTLFGPVPPRVAEPGTARLQMLLTQHGVSGAVALSTRGAYHNAHAGNRETLALCQQSGGVLIPAAVLDPRLPQAAQSIGGAKVLCFLPAMQKWPLMFEPLIDVLETLCEMGENESVANTPVWWEAARMGDATQIEHVLQEAKYPAPVVLGGVTGETLVEALSVARKNKTFFVATNGLRGVGEIEMAVSTLGANRVVFASAAPARSLGAALGLVEQADLSQADADLVLGGNARRLLGLPLGGAA